MPTITTTELNHNIRDSDINLILGKLMVEEEMKDIGPQAPCGRSLRRFKRAMNL